MSSLVSEFIINPVLRQARRFSEISRSTFAGDDNDRPVMADVDVDTEADADRGLSVAEDAMEISPAPESREDAEPVEQPMTPRSRTVNTTTQETRVDEMAGLSPPGNSVDRDHLGFPLSTRRGRGIAEDDGMRVLRKRIQAINSQNISSEDKARQMHEILLEGYRTSQVAGLNRTRTPPRDTESPGFACEPSTSPGPLESLKSWYSQQADQTVATEKFVLSESDIAPTFAPMRQLKGSDADLQSQSPVTPPGMQAPLGCQHYERNVKLQCFTCKKWYTCRFCHDAEEDHSLIRRETRNMLCMLCATPQRASDMCINCGEMSANYYCNICHLWENRKSRPIYHCNDCGICRRGLGLGKDFFHCKTCRACITTSIQSSHKCIERSTDCDCPICGEYMFTSPKPVVFMTCGHSIHKKCYDQHMRVSYKCPICNKSLANMETQFRNLDVAIMSQPMPPEFRDTRVTVLCNDCSGKCVVAYHWLGLKCSICQSYNTVELQIHGQSDRDLQPVAQRAAEAVSNTQTQRAVQLQRHAATPPANMAAAPSRAITRMSSRRRHSSQGVELQHRALDISAQHATSLDTTQEGVVSHAHAEVDSDDDILGFWRGHRSQGQDNGDEASDSDDSDEYSDDDAGADDDDDDDFDNMQLIGHR